MMFVIKHKSRLYFHNRGRIILFETQEEAQYFLELFSQYSMQKLAQNGNPMEVMRVPMILQGECSIEPVDFNIDNIECGTVMMEELFEKMEY